MMFYKISKLIRAFLSISVPENHKTEFDLALNRINVTRAKITAITFVIIEVLVLTASFAVKREDLLKKPGIYYGIMYVLFLVVMMVFSLIFIKLESNADDHGTGIRISGVTFTCFALSWCAGISLLDQLSSGQVIVYTAAIIAIAATPFFKPVTFIAMYLSIHMIFLVLMPYFQKSSGILYANYLNSTTFIIISLAVSYMRYKKLAEDFKNRKIIQEQSEELKQINLKLEELSQTDSLTGVFNRLMFDGTLKTEWGRCSRHSKPLSLIMTDIDFFKEYNDNNGHLTGDDCLKRIAVALSACAKRSSDVVARYGGDEFAVILPYTENENALVLAGQMRKKVEELAIPHAHPVAPGYVTISLGVCTVIPSNETSVEEFIKAADNALYEAKKSRNAVVAV